jgi:hypothetical protein
MESVDIFYQIEGSREIHHLEAPVRAQFWCGQGPSY